MARETPSRRAGAAVEAGRTDRRRGEELLEAEVVDIRKVPPTRRSAPPAAAPTLGSPDARSISPRSCAHASPRAERDSTRHADDDLQATLSKPWRGQAENLKPAQKRVLEQFEERAVRDRIFDGGVMIDIAKTKYWVRADGEATGKVTTRLNITRLFDDLLKSKHCPYETKKASRRTSITGR